MDDKRAGVCVCVCVGGGVGGGDGLGLTTGLPVTLCAIYKLESF